MQAVNVADVTAGSLMPLKLAWKLFISELIDDVFRHLLLVVKDLLFDHLDFVALGLASVNLSRIFLDDSSRLAEVRVARRRATGLNDWLSLDADRHLGSWLLRLLMLLLDLTGSPLVLWGFRP